MTEATQRRLAAIVAADVVGYSRLLGADEAGTLAALRAHRAELIDGLIAQHGGRIVKTMGDGLLLEFPSVVQATQCVLEVQQGMAERNQGIGEDKCIAFRVGVHLGDVVVEGDDILGDGVNVAARLEGVSTPGGIALSGTAYENIAGRIDASFADGGEQELKNIARPVRVWQWSNDAEPRTADTPLPLPDKPSIAVLPFDNMSSDSEQEYFADGITEDIITALSKVSRMRVIARNSTFAYKGQAIDLRRVASELGVRYVVEGSVRSGGNRLRITAQLIDASDGSHVWAERFDRAIDDIFDVQDEITKEVVTALRVNLTDGEEALLSARGTNNIEAWQLCIHAAELLYRWNTTDYIEARELTEKALARDPNYAYAWTIMGDTYWFDGRLGYTGDAEAKYTQAKECAERALTLDDSLPWAIGLSAVVAGSQNRVADGVTIARRGFELYPGIADLRGYFGLALTRAEEYGEAAKHFRAAMSLNPFCPNWYYNGLSRALLFLGEYEEALGFCEQVLDLEPTHLNSWLQKACVLSQTGRLDEAKDAVAEIHRLAPDLRLGHVPELLMVGDEVKIQHLIDSLNEVGLPE